MFPSRAQVAKIKTKYPKGTRVQLIKMNDPQAPPVGTKGIVQGVDDIGSILVQWESDSRLSLIVGEDEFRVLRENEMNAKVKEQILAIRDSGETNMFNTQMVQYIANRENYFELVIFIEEHQGEYVHFILTGE